jgi:hypothetical protein
MKPLSLVALISASALSASDITPPGLSIDGVPYSGNTAHPDFNQEPAGGYLRGAIPAGLEDLQTFDLGTLVVADKTRIIVDPTGPDIFLPEPTFFGTHVSDDWRATLGYDQVSGNWQLRFSDSDLIRTLPMVAASDFAYRFPEDTLFPAVMVDLLANGLSADGSTVIANGNGASFRYRGDERDRLEHLAHGWRSGYDNTWAVQQSRNGDTVVGQARRADTGRWQAARWDASGQLTILNPRDLANNSVARLVTPDGTVIAGDVAADVGQNRAGIVPFIWSEAKGFLQLGDPDASDDQILVQSLSADGLMLGGIHSSSDGSLNHWTWTEDGGFQNIELIVCDFSGGPVEDYSLTGVDLERGIYMGTFADGRRFLNMSNQTVVIEDWISTLAGPAATYRAATAVSRQTMEGAHHRPIKQLVIPGQESFAWATGDFGKATRQRDAVQSAGEFGYGMLLGGGSVLGLAAGYSKLDQKFSSLGNGGGAGTTEATFLVADLGFSAGAGEVTLTGLLSRSNIDTSRDAYVGSTNGQSYSARARYDRPIGVLSGVPFGAFVSLTYDHASIDAYAETGGLGAASFEAQSNDSWIGRVGLTGRFSFDEATSLGVTVEAVRMLSENRDDFSGTDLATGVLDFTMPDLRSKRTWGRLGFDLDHRLDPSTVLSLTLHASTEGDAFDTAAALSIRKGF